MYERARSSRQRRASSSRSAMPCPITPTPLRRTADSKLSLPRDPLIWHYTTTVSPHSFSHYQEHCMSDPSESTGAMEYHHRLVVRTPFLEWRIPLDINVGGIRIRFEKQITGECIEPTRQTQSGETV